ncbi:MAG: hypothetical protein U0X92_13275 [Anaerolineales bacterium]
MFVTTRLWVKWVELRWQTRKLETTQNWKSIQNALKLTNNEIAARLHLSQKLFAGITSKFSRNSARQIRTQAVQKAGELNLLTGRERSVEPKRKTLAVRYVSNGGIHIAYQIIGEGHVDLLFITAFSFRSRTRVGEQRVQKFFEEIGKFARVILF